MSRFYALRNKDGELFAGFKHSANRGLKYEPTFIKPVKGCPVQIACIHEDDIAETEQDLAKFNISTDRVQVG